MDVRERMIAQINRIDHDYAVKVATYIGVKVPNRVPTPEKKTAPGLSNEDLPKLGVKAMKIGIVAGPDAHVPSIERVIIALKNGGANSEIIAKDLNPIGQFQPNGTLLNTPSAVYDAICIVGGDGKVFSLAEDDDALLFVREAYKHGKALAACGNAAAVVAHALPSVDQIKSNTQGRGLVLSTDHVDNNFERGFLEAAATRHWGRSGQMPKQLMS
jgi:catalase